jgi:hypothetical protein
MVMRTAKGSDYLGTFALNVVWFDSIPEYLVNWQLTVIGHGILP